MFLADFVVAGSKADATTLNPIGMYLHQSGPCRLCRGARSHHRQNRLLLCPAKPPPADSTPPGASIEGKSQNVFRNVQASLAEHNNQLARLDGHNIK